MYNIITTLRDGGPMVFVFAYFVMVAISGFLFACLHSYVRSHPFVWGEFEKDLLPDDSGPSSSADSPGRRQYRYNVDGKEYTGTRVSLIEASEPKARAWIEKKWGPEYHEDGRLKVFYKQKNPDFSFLTRSTTAQIKSSLFGGVLGLAIAGYCAHELGFFRKLGLL